MRRRRPCFVSSCRRRSSGDELLSQPARVSAKFCRKTWAVIMLLILHRLWTSFKTENMCFRGFFFTIRAEWDSSGDVTPQHIVPQGGFFLPAPVAGTWQTAATFFLGANPHKQTNMGWGQHEIVPNTLLMAANMKGGGRKKNSSSISLRTKNNTIGGGCGVNAVRRITSDDALFPCQPRLRHPPTLTTPIKQALICSVPMMVKPLSTECTAKSNGAVYKNAKGASL